MDDEVSAAQVERTARHSTALEWSVRAGLAGYGLVHLLVAWVAVALALGQHAGAATGQGALAQLASGGIGRATLAVMAIAFGALVLWQLAAGVVGYRDRDGWSRHLMRIGAVCRAVAFGYLMLTCGRLALAGGSGRRRTPDSTTATLMSLPAGQVLVALVAVVAIAIGIGMVVFGWRRDFVDQLDSEARNGDRRAPIVVVGTVGYVAKGLAFLVIGTILAWAAWTHDPQRSGGLDQALYRLLGGSLGTAAVLVVGGGIGCFGVFLLARAWHLNRHTLTA